MKEFIIIILIIAIVNCTENTVIEKAKFQVSGTITEKEVPSPNVNVALLKDNKVIKETTTDINGHFEINEVPEDNYVLSPSKSTEDGKFVSNPTSINVNSNLVLENIKLPEPISLFEPTQIKNSSITLIWSKFSSENFYEYKIYRHATSGLDEDTGILIHVSTSVNDTIFIDEGKEFSNGLSPNTTYYYRVFVHNNYGKLSGSNIINATTTKWENEDAFTVFYNLRPESDFPGFGGNIKGIDFDGEYLWILELKSVGGYYTNNEYKLIQYDYLEDTIVKEYEYSDEYIEPRALAYNDSSLYIVFGPLNSFIKKINYNTGTIERVYSSTFYEDISIDNGLLYSTKVAVDHDLIQKFNIQNFSYINSIDVPIWNGIIGGIAKRDNEIWISSRFDDYVIILDDDGKQIGAIKVNAKYSHLCFMKNKFVIAHGNRVYIFNIE